MTHMTQFFNFFKVKKKLRYHYVIPFFSNLVKKKYLPSAFYYKIFDLKQNQMSLFY